MSNTSLVIVAGGLNTRFKSLAKFPKLLLPTEEDGSILLHYVKKKDHFKSITILINEKYSDMLNQYIDNVIGWYNGIKVVVTSNTNGSYNTIKSVESELPTEDTLFVWSDLILDDVDKVAELCASLNDTTIFTKDGHYRFRLEDHQLKPVKDNGNIPGVYFMKKVELKIDLDKLENFDLVESFIDAKDVELPSTITEYRDLEIYKEKYLNYPQVKKTRFFNEMVDNGDGTLTKKCVDKNFNKLIERECDWYEFAAEKKMAVPKIYKMNRAKHYIKMEKINGLTLEEHIKTKIKDEVEFGEFMDKYVDAIEHLHGWWLTCNSENVEKSCRTEFYDKVIDRCDKISCLIDGYCKERLEEYLDRAFKKILNQVMAHNSVMVSFGHGDLNGSNVMVRDDGEIVFIDPRGYFGSMELFFPEVYDFAKVLYMFTGYDQFNNGRFIYYTEDEYDHPKPLVEWKLPQVIDNEVNRLIVGIIWIALAQYISQDIMKVNIAYHYGMSILEELLDGEQ